MGGAAEDEGLVSRVGLAEGALGLGGPSEATRGTEATKMWPSGRSVGGRRTPGWVEPERNGHIPLERARERAGKEGVAGAGWAGAGGAEAECAWGSSLATPALRPPATCAPPCQPHPS